MFCEKCGAENPNDAQFCTGCGRKLKPSAVKKEKDMFLALVISFILPGIGIAYAGNVKKAVALFAVALICGILGFGLSYLRIIAILIWIIALYLTYVEVEKSNGRENPDILEDFKTWTTPKKIGAVIAVIVILLIAIAGIIGAFMPADNSSGHISDYSSSSGSGSSLGSSSSSSGSASSGSNSYSSSSNGHDVESHYEGEYGSADTHGTVYDDGSVESHQTGHTDYGDYQIDSYMDSDGNIHGTVDVGGHKYHVNN